MRPHAGILPTDPDHGPLVLREEDAEHVDTLASLVTVRRGVRRLGTPRVNLTAGLSGPARRRPLSLAVQENRLRRRDGTWGPLALDCQWSERFVEGG